MGEAWGWLMSRPLACPSWSWIEAHRRHLRLSTAVLSALRYCDTVNARDASHLAKTHQGLSFSTAADRASICQKQETWGRRCVLSPELVIPQQLWNGTSGARGNCYCGTGNVTGPVLKVDDLDPEKRCLLDRYLEFLLEENQKHNLTGGDFGSRWSVDDGVGIGSYEEAIEQLVHDSTALLPFIGYSADASIRLVDVGSGAGIPGIIFGILMPNWKVRSHLSWFVIF